MGTLRQKELSELIITRQRRYLQGDLIVDFPAVYCYDFKDLIAFGVLPNVPAEGLLHSVFYAG